MGKLLQMSGIIVDLVYQVDEVPQAGQEAHVHDFALLPGGGYNAMVAAIRCGLSVTYGGSIGTGPFSDVVVHELTRLNIETLQQRQPSIDQGCCTVLVDSNGERTFIAKDGAEGVVTPTALNQLELDHYQWILLSGYSLVYRESRDSLAKWLQTLPPSINLLFDPCPLVQEIPSTVLASVLKRADWISANRIESALLTGIGNPAEAASQLKRARQGAIVRDGANGCFLADTESNAEHIKGFAVNAVDTNGAGDCHIGAFIAALDRGDPAVTAARLANAAAAISITRPGPATAPNLVEIHRLLNATDSTK